MAVGQASFLSMLAGGALHVTRADRGRAGPYLVTGVTPGRGYKNLGWCKWVAVQHQRRVTVPRAPPAMYAMCDGAGPYLAMCVAPWPRPNLVAVLQLKLRGIEDCGGRQAGHQSTLAAGDSPLSSASDACGAWQSGSLVGDACGTGQRLEKLRLEQVWCRRLDACM